MAYLEGLDAEDKRNIILGLATAGADAYMKARESKSKSLREFHEGIDKSISKTLTKLQKMI